MKQPLLLDCTLRDGGYVNNWNFGERNILDIVHTLEMTGVNIIELGFLRDFLDNPDSSNLSAVETANRILKDKKDDVIYSAMIEAFNPYPVDKITEHSNEGIDLLRICIWKRCIKEHMDYCRAISDKGYKITIQPSRVEQYNDDEFVDMLKRSNELSPYAVYVVDTWGTQSSMQICHYIELADKYLLPNIKIGYHGHNNKMQALSCACAVIDMELSRDLCIDSSIMGMGRGAGNLNTEIIMEYLNERFGKKYNVEAVQKCFISNLRSIYSDRPWGYSMYYFLCAVNGCNPNYATYFSDNSLGENLFCQVLNSLSDQEKIVFNKELVIERIAKFEVC